MSGSAAPSARPTASGPPRTSSPSPVSSPSPAPNAAIAAAAAANANAGNTKDIYGLGNDATSPIDVSGLPPSILNDLQKTGVRINTAQDLMEALGKIGNKDPSAMSALQQMLWYANMYDKTAATDASDAATGQFDPNTATALVKLVKISAETQTPVGNYLNTSALIGQAKGQIDQAIGIGSSQNLIGIEHPSPVTVDAGLRSEAEALLGYDLGPDDYARFQAFYDNLYTSMSKATVQATARSLGNAGAYGTPEQLAGAYVTQSQAGQPAPISGADPVSRLLDFGAQGQAQTEASNEIQTVQNADTTPGTFDYTAQPSAISGPKDAADQYLRANYGAAVSQQNALTNYGKLIQFMKGGGDLPTS